MAASSPSLLALLRQATRPAHRELDALSPLGGERPARAGYALHLRALADLTWFLETTFYATDEWKRQVPDHARRLKAARLREDLTALGERFDPAALQPPFLISSFGYGMGAAYVLEGSTLGGAVLARRIRDSLGPDAPIRYLTAYGDEIGPMWSAFCTVLDGLPPSLHRDACAGGHDAFEAVKRRFVELGAGARSG